MTKIFTSANINFPILELAYVRKELYPNGEGYHFTVSYLIDVNGIETVLEAFPTTIDQLMQFPLIDLDTPIQLCEQNGNVVTVLLTTSVREELVNPRPSHKDLIIEHLLEGNNREDLAEYAYDLMSEDERNKILDEIDNAKLEQDVANQE